RDVQRRVRRGERLGAGFCERAELADREARDREGVHAAGSTAGAGAAVDQAGHGRCAMKRLALVGLLAISADVYAKPVPPPTPAGPSKAVTTDIIDAVAE